MQNVLQHISHAYWLVIVWLPKELGVKVWKIHEQKIILKHRPLQSPS